MYAVIYTSSPKLFVNNCTFNIPGPWQLQVWKLIEKLAMRGSSNTGIGSLMWVACLGGCLLWMKHAWQCEVQCSLHCFGQFSIFQVQYMCLVHSHCFNLMDRSIHTMGADGRDIGVYVCFSWVFLIHFLQSIVKQKKYYLIAARIPPGLGHNVAANSLCGCSSQASWA